MSIRQVSYSNTFSEWMIVTNQLVARINVLDTGDFEKSNGTLLITSSNTGLDVSNTAIFRGNTYILGNLYSNANSFFANIRTADLTVTANTYLNDLYVYDKSILDEVIVNTSFVANGDIQINGTSTIVSPTLTGNTVITSAAITTLTATNASVSNLTVSGNTNHTGTGFIRLPVGTTGQRPGGAIGQMRYNSTISRFEGYQSSGWKNFGGAVGPGSDSLFYENDQTLSDDYTLIGDKNYMTAGPISIANNKTLTIANNAYWTIV